VRPVDIKPMIPLGQFRDTFIIAVDDEGVAIIDRTSRTSASCSSGSCRRCAGTARIAAAAGADAPRRVGARAPARPRRELERSASRSKARGTTIKVMAVPRC
jgi:hypothetical protein